MESPRIDTLFRAMVAVGASDLHLSVGATPMVRKDGRMQPLDPAMAPLTGPMVTTKIVGYQHRDQPETQETLIQIGGRVFDVADPIQGISGATVYLQEVDQTAVTDNEGRYTFVRLAAGTYTARAWATGYQPRERTMHVPGPSEEYELTLEPATP